MSVALADLLIELADPENLEKFEENPDAVMVAAGLTEIDKKALISRKSGWIRYQAREDGRSVTELIEHEGEISAGTALDVIDVIDVVDVVVVL